MNAASRTWIIAASLGAAAMGCTVDQTPTRTIRQRIKTRIADQVVIKAPRDLDVRTIVVGGRLEAGETGYHFVDSMDRVEQIVPKGVRLLYRRNALVPPKNA
jgi:hypothetical protein